MSATKMNAKLEKFDESKVQEKERKLVIERRAYKGCHLDRLFTISVLHKGKLKCSPISSSLSDKVEDRKGFSCNDKVAA